jgi:hypothetical protein
MAFPAEVAEWPVFRAFAPRYDIWRATGYGSAAIFRRAPDGRVATALFALGLAEGGITMAFGKVFPSELAAEKVLALREFLPAMDESPPEHSALFVLGAQGLREALDRPGIEKMDDYLRLFGPSSQSHAVALSELLARTPEDLVRISEGIARANAAAPSASNADAMVHTKMTFRAEEPTALLVRLRESAPAFGEISSPNAATHELFWSRENPEHESRPMAGPGERQLLGTVSMESERIVAETTTLSFAALLAKTLLELSGGKLHLVGTEWHVHPAEHRARLRAVRDTDDDSS